MCSEAPLLFPSHISLMGVPLATGAAYLEGGRLIGENLKFTEKFRK